MNRMGAIESDAWTANYNAISARMIGPTNSTLQKAGSKWLRRSFIKQFDALL